MFLIFKFHDGEVTPCLGEFLLVSKIGMSHMLFQPIKNNKPLPNRGKEKCELGARSFSQTETGLPAFPSFAPHAGNCG